MHDDARTPALAVQSPLRLAPSALAQIREHGEETYPFECCGALIGRGRCVNRVLRLPNTTDEGPRTRFLVRPDDYRAAEGVASRAREALLGFYHSHPDHPAMPSAFDLAHAWPVFSYVIVAVADGRAADIRSWHLCDDRSRFDEEALTVMATTVFVPTPLRPFVDRQEQVVIEGDTVGEILITLTTRYPDLRRHLFTEEGRLRSFVNVYLNDRDVRYLARDATPVGAGDTVSIIPSVAGGTSAAPAATTATAPLSHDEVRRYSRHLIMPEVGVDGQQRLKAARVLCVGAGGLGSPVTMYLAAAGVGTLGLVDFDVVDVSNLQRQILHGTTDVGRPKLESARDRLSAINPHVAIEPHETALSRGNALDLLAGYDVIVDGTDNFPTRYLVNDACVLLGKPNVYGSIFRFEGQASVFATADGPCYRCLYPEPPPAGLVPSCAEGGVLGVLPGIIGTIQAMEAIKIILGAGQPLIGRLLVFDALGMRFREFALQRDPSCPICGDNRTIHELVDYDELCGVTPHDPAREPGDVTVQDLHQWLSQPDAPQLVDVREPQEHQICRIAQARLIPLGELPRRLQEIDASRPVVVHCKSGQRSAKAVSLLRGAGFDARNLRGGILAWIDEVDRTQPKY